MHPTETPTKGPLTPLSLPNKTLENQNSVRCCSCFFLHGRTKRPAQTPHVAFSNAGVCFFHQREKQADGCIYVYVLITRELFFFFCAAAMMYAEADLPLCAATGEFFAEIFGEDCKISSVNATLNEFPSRT